ncbi:TPA: PD-(D/E)XK nuclease family protein [Pseudomonas putida]
MDVTDLDAALEQLMADQDLISLCELQRTGDEILDVISLHENQHSDILGWMFDPREGHGQGDQILRDLLMAASMRAASGESGLDNRCTTAKFFKEWPPSRIRISSFGTAFYARELGMKPAERVDLFIIDPQNKFVLLIENKSRSGHTAAQLTGYRDSFSALVAKSPHLRPYKPVYIALDRDFYAEDNKLRPCADTWLHLGYEWLKTSADRALVHVERGNAAARLVVSYCNRQSDWQSPETKRCNELAAALHWKHPVAIKELLKPSSQRIEKDWLQTKNPDNTLMFMLQNKDVIQTLRDTRGMTSVKTAIHKRLPTIPLSSVEHARAWLNLCPSGWEQADGNLWPVYMCVRFSNSDQTRFTLWLVRNAAAYVDVQDAKTLQQQLVQIDARFSSFGDSQLRRVPLATGLPLVELLKRIEEHNSRLWSISPLSHSTMQAPA